MKEIFFTSDTHFNFSNILKYRKTFKDVYQMNECLIYNWNSKVKEKDIVYHLGDVCNGYFDDIRKKLNGEIFLIKGNHDKKINKINFYKIYDYFELNYNNYNIKLFHYPLLSWNGINKKKKIHLFGHTHNDLYNRNGLSLNVGVDTNNLFPYSFEEILIKIGFNK